MTELHAGLQLYRDQLRDAARHDLERAARSRSRARRATRLAIPAAVAAAATAIVVAFAGGSPSQSADAAILHHVAAELAPPPGSILHERAIVTLNSQTAPYELWELSDAPHSYRVIKWGHEGTGSGGQASDWAAMLRSLVDSGQAHVVASTTLDGVPAYKLSVSGAPDRFLNGTVYVAQADYRPLLIDTAVSGGEERIVVQTYEYLPATPANLALLRR